MGSAADVSGGAVSFLAFCYSSYCLSLSPILFTFASYCETLYRYFSIRFKIFDFPTLRPAYPTLRPMAAVLFHLFPALEIHCSIYLLSYFFPPLSLSFHRYFFLLFHLYRYSAENYIGYCYGCCYCVVGIIAVSMDDYGSLTWTDNHAQMTRPSDSLIVIIVINKQNPPPQKKRKRKRRLNV